MECNVNFKQWFNVFLVICEAWQGYELKAYGVSNHNLKLQFKKFRRTRDIPNFPTQCWADTAFYTSNWNGTYPNGKLISYRLACEKFGLDLMRYNSIISAIPLWWKKGLKEENTDGEDDYPKRPTRYVYHQLASDNSMLTSKIMKWEEELSTEVEHDVFCYCFIFSHQCAEIQEFQYRLLHKAIITNNHLFKCWKVYIPNRSLCGEECETYLHLFIFCPHVKRLWITMDTFMGKFSGQEINSQTDTVISNKLVKSAGDVKNFICLVVKQYMSHFAYACKMRYPLNLVLEN